MSQPALLLTGFSVLVLIVAALAWPRRGVVAQLRRIMRQTDRVRTEDAIKYLYHAGTDGDVVRPEALAGALGVRNGVARQLLERLASRGFTSTDRAGYTLTDDGRRDALRLVRTHRLIERWLADQTGVAPSEWHEWAEMAEHDLTPAEMEALAARLGQPRFDPHGDPIPTAAGELPSDAPLLLGAIPVGEGGVIAHLEDEPSDAYEALGRDGLALGTRLVVRDRDATSVTIEVEGRRVRLSRLLEPAVSVRQARIVRTERAHTLAELSPGQSGRVARISLACAGAQRRRLLDLGVVPGTEITAVLRSAGGDPMAYTIRGALIALRRQQAEWIELAPAGSRDADASVA
jgi:DtxR family transcriptional regulator, Mn-dependent transcriptional regulator